MGLAFLFIRGYISFIFHLQNAIFSFLVCLAQRFPSTVTHPGYQDLMRSRKDQKKIRLTSPVSVGLYNVSLCVHSKLRNWRTLISLREIVKARTIIMKVLDCRRQICIIQGLTGEFKTERSTELYPTKQRAERCMLGPCSQTFPWHSTVSSVFLNRRFCLFCMLLKILGNPLELFQGT